MRLEEIVTTSTKVGATRSRKEKIALLAATLARLAPEERDTGLAYLAGELPQGKIGLGYALVFAARPAGAAPRGTLELREVERALGAIQARSGPGSKAARLADFEALLARATLEEQGFLRRLVMGELRQGALEGLLVEALARAADVPVEAVRRAAMLEGELRDVARAAFEGGAEALARSRLRVLRPLQPMLAQTAADPEEALAALGRASFEHKLDGARVQLHKAGDEVRVFTRNLNDVTHAVPELVEAALLLPARELVLDGEALAFDRDGRPLPFQTTMRRFGRKLAVEALRAELPLEARWFDLLHVDGADLVERGGAERWAALEALVPPEQRVTRLATDEPEAAEAFYAAALAGGHEGVMAKALDAPYEAGRRGARWLKLKPAHALDLVVLAAEWGSGRREGTLSNLWLGARDPHLAVSPTGFVMLGKTFKGMSDETLAWQTERLLAHEERREGPVVHVRPELVSEILLDGVQESPHYPGGLALRFARLRRHRPDKSAAEADTLETVRALHAAKRGKRTG